MIAEALESRLRQWNTVCTLGEHPAYREWLEKSYPHWGYAADFSRLRVEIVNVWDGITNMLIKGERCYISWASPEKVMNIGPEFVEAGLLAIGSSPGGDIMVIDTHAEKELAIGFVDHEMLWSEKEVEPKAAFRPWRDDLLTFLDKMAENEKYVP